MNLVKKTPATAGFQRAKAKVLGMPTAFEHLFGGPESQAVMQSASGDIRHRLFPPLTTLWVFVTQVLNTDQSCRLAIAQYLSTLKDKVCSLATGAYCQARKRLTESMIQALCVAQAKHVEKDILPEWQWRARRVKLVDATTISMPDTADNQRHFPATNKKRNPLEFPIARVAVVVCKTTGILIHAAIGAYQGKQSGEPSLLKQMRTAFSAGDVAVFDRYYAGFFTLAWVKEQNADYVCRQHHLRKVGKTIRLGKNDVLFTITKPKRPREMSMEEYKAYPEELVLRRVIVVVHTPGFRCARLEVITSLVDKRISSQDLAELYRSRWFVEVDLRTIKVDMGMKVLRCKTASMVRKEIWVHFLAYNLVRSVLIDAAKAHRQLPRQVSFKAALQLICSFRCLMARATNAEWSRMYQKILTALAHQVIGNRPSRYEPRLKKRRSNDKYLTVPRAEARKRCRNRAA